MLHNFYIRQAIKITLQRKNIIFFCLIICSLLFSWGAKSDNGSRAISPNPSGNIPHIEESSPSADQADVSSMDAIIKAIYDSLSFHEKGEPNFNRFRFLFNPKAPLIRITAEGVNVWDVEGFASFFMGRVQRGEVKSFYEAEISRKTDAFGSIAQIFSTYKKAINTQNPESFVRGINNIQLYFDGQRWWISSLLWEDERIDNPIPQKYLR